MEKSYKYWIYHYRISIELFGRYVIAYYFEQFIWVKYHWSKQYCIFIKVSWLHIRLAILMELYGNTLFMLGTSCEFYYYFSIIIIKLLYLNCFFYKNSVFSLVQDEYSQLFLPNSSWYIFSIFLLYINKAIGINLPRKGP